MAASHRNISAPPCPPESNKEFHSLSNYELFSFMSDRRPEFVRIVGILKAREDSAKAASLKDLSASIAELQNKNDILEKKLLILKNNETEIGKLKQGISDQKRKRLVGGIAELEEKKKHCARLERELADLKKDCMALRESEDLAQQKIKVLMEESANRRAQDEIHTALSHKYFEIDLKFAISVNVAFCSRLLTQIMRLKRECSALEVSQEKTSRRCRTLEELQLKLEKARKERMIMFDLWKSKCSPKDSYILRFLEIN